MENDQRMQKTEESQRTAPAQADATSFAICATVQKFAFSTGKTNAKRVAGAHLRVEPDLTGCPLNKKRGPRIESPMRKCVAGGLAAV